MTDLKRAIFVYFPKGNELQRDSYQFTRVDDDGNAWMLHVTSHTGVRWNYGQNVDRAYVERAIAEADHWNQFD